MLFFVAASLTGVSPPAYALASILLMSLWSFYFDRCWEHFYGDEVMPSHVWPRGIVAVAGFFGAPAG